MENEQKTLTSVKKTDKIGLADNQSLLSPIGSKSKIKGTIAPSQSFLDKVISNVNNTLKPPNWTKRKQSLMSRLNSQVSPSCASNIDEQLEQLASVYKESQKNFKEGREPSLMEQLVDANPSNASFHTPSSIS